MAALDSPDPLVLRVLPHGSETSSDCVCVPIEAELAKTSSVLETLLEFDGCVELPAGVSVENLVEWAAIARQEPSSLSLGQLGVGLQVGAASQHQNEIINNSINFCSPSPVGLARHCRKGNCCRWATSLAYATLPSW